MVGHSHRRQTTPLGQRVPRIILRQWIPPPHSSAVTKTLSRVQFGGSCLLFAVCRYCCWVNEGLVRRLPQTASHLTSLCQNVAQGGIWTASSLSKRICHGHTLHLQTRLFTCRVHVQLSKKPVLPLVNKQWNMHSVSQQCVYAELCVMYRLNHPCLGDWQYSCMLYDYVGLSNMCVCTFGME